MSIDLKPKDEIEIDGKTLVVQPDPEMPKRPYVELGGNGRVVQLVDAKTSEYYALKIFNNPETVLVNKTEILKNSNIRQLSGLLAAQRSVINPRIKLHKPIIQKYPFLKYSILMPWIGGYTWFEILGDNKGEATLPVFNRETCLYYASQLAQLLASLETIGYAHCDVCSNNIILDLENPSVQLIDIEDMFIPDMVQNKDFIGGQDGYAHPNPLQGHQWIKEGDRFGGGMLISEILTWCDPLIRKASDKESFAVPSELCKENSKYDLMKAALRQHGGVEISALFERLWESDSLESCPPLLEWDKKISEVVESEGVTKPVLNGLPLFREDGRIRIQRKSVSVKQDREEPEIPIKTVRKKVSTTSSKSTPIFQPETDWGKVIGWGITILLIVIGFAMLSSIGGNEPVPTPKPSYTVNNVEPVVVVPTRTSRPKPTATHKLPLPTSTPVPTKTNTPMNAAFLSSIYTETVQPREQSLPSDYECDDREKLYLSVGQWARTAHAGMGIHEEYLEYWDASAKSIRMLPEKERILVFDGPVCSSDGHTWWFVKTESSQFGWVIEYLRGGDGHFFNPMN